MTNQQQPLWTPPPRFYWYNHLPHVEQAKASKMAQERVAEEFVHKVQVGVDILTRREPDAEKRKGGYRRKPVELWVGQRVYFPRMFEKDWADWERIDTEDVAVELRAAILQQVEMQAADLERQLLLDEAQARAGPPAPTAPALGPMGDQGASNVVGAPPAAPGQ